MHKKKLMFGLKVNFAFFNEQGETFSMEIPIMKIDEHCNFIMKGKDSKCGEFKFSGNIGNNPFLLEKTCDSRTYQYYAELNKYTISFFQKDSEYLMKAENVDFIGQIILDGEHFLFELTSTPQHVFLSINADANGSRKGIALINDKIYQCLLRMVDENKGKLSVKCAEEQKAWIATISDNVITVVLVEENPDDLCG